MEIKALLRNQLVSGREILTKAAEPLTEDEFHVHLPGPGVSPNWVFGHLAVNEDWFLSILTGSAIALDAELIAMYQDDTSYKQEVPITTSRHGTHPTKREILDLFESQRTRVLDALDASDTSDWLDPAPDGMPAVFDTVGAVWGVIGTHQYWHIGQLMSIRHMLGKPPFQF